MTSPPGPARNLTSAQLPRTRTRGGGSLRRNVLLRCGGCGATVTGWVRGRRLSFNGLAEVTTAQELARNRWLEADVEGKRRLADRLKREFWAVEHEPAQLIHKCGGEVSAFDLQGKSAS